MRQVINCPGRLPNYFSLILISIEAVCVLVIEQPGTTVPFMWLLVLGEIGLLQR